MSPAQMWTCPQLHTHIHRLGKLVVTSKLCSPACESGQPEIAAERSLDFEKINCQM